jgi:hypothetical protein
MRVIILILLLGFTTTSASEIEIVYDPGLPNRGDTSKEDWHRDHGSIAKILGDTVARVRIRYYDPRRWKDADEVRAYLTAVLRDRKSETFEAPIWQEGFDTTVEAVIEFKDGTRGIWALDGRLSCLQDSGGKYWFALHEDAWRAVQDARKQAAGPTTGP